jgi:hypothetical protein
MFVGQVTQARELYLRYRGTKSVKDAKSWEALVLEDFAEFRQAGLSDPLMDEIEKTFSAGG